MMFQNFCLISILCVGSLLSSDIHFERKSQRSISDNIKKIVVPIGVGIAGAVISQRGIFLNNLQGIGNPSFSGFLISESYFDIITANIKLIPAGLLCNEKMSLKNAQNLCSVMSLVHGLGAAAVCRYALNRFFPG